MPQDECTYPGSEDAHSIDASEEMLKIAKQRHLKYYADLPITFDHVAAQDARFLESSFDLALSIMEIARRQGPYVSENAAGARAQNTKDTQVQLK